MARLPNEEWLSMAKSCAVGMNKRVRHLHERDPAMVVGNKGDRWWAYCQRCKRGAVEMKSHVMLTPPLPAQSSSLVKPADAKPVTSLPGYQQEWLAKFLASKGMDLMYFEKYPLTWSESRHRLLVSTQQGLMGRDTSGRSEQKWLTYDGQHYSLPSRELAANVLLTEDMFSFIKLDYALQLSGLSASITPVCTLGTAMHDTLFLKLLSRRAQTLSFYDGDPAGWKGAVSNEMRLYAQRLSPGNVTQFEMCAPKGLDPKDMSLTDLTNHARGLFAIS